MAALAPSAVELGLSSPSISLSQGRPLMRNLRTAQNSVRRQRAQHAREVETVKTATARGLAAAVVVEPENVECAKELELSESEGCKPGTLKRVSISCPNASNAVLN